MCQFEIPPNLDEAVHALYEAFKKYNTRHHPEGCPCCVGDDDKRRLFSRPLKELTSDDLERFARKALTTWGTVEDLKHFLPRLLDLVPTDDCPSFDREVLLGKLRLAGWRTWPENERKAIESFLAAVWWNCLTSEAGWVWLDELLCGLGNAVDDVSPYLKIWTNCRLITGYGHLVHFINDNSATLLKRRHLWNAFWSEAEDQMRQIIDWLSSSQTLKTLEGIFAEKPDSNYSDALAIAADRLSMFQRTLNAN